MANSAGGIKVEEGDGGKSCVREIKFVNTVVIVIYIPTLITILHIILSKLQQIHIHSPLIRSQMFSDIQRYLP